MPGVGQIVLDERRVKVSQNAVHREQQVADAAYDDNSGADEHAQSEASGQRAVVYGGSDKTARHARAQQQDAGEVE